MLLPMNFVYEHQEHQVHLHLAKHPAPGLESGVLVEGLFSKSTSLAHSSRRRRRLRHGPCIRKRCVLWPSEVVSDEGERERIAGLFFRKYIDDTCLGDVRARVGVAERLGLVCHISASGSERL